MDVRQGKYYFTADVHMGMTDDPLGKREKDFVDFLRSLPKDARQIHLLGDVFDFWIDYKDVVPRGYVRVLAALADLTDRGVQVFFYPGNHDWWVTDYFEKELGVKIVKECCTVIELDGKRICLGHGDMPAAARGKSRLIFHLFHSKFWIAVLRAMPVRFVFSLARTWSAGSRRKHPEAESTRPYAANGSNDGPCDGRKGLDVCRTGLYQFADSFGRDRAAAGEPPVDLYIFGHIHTPARVKVPSGGELLILGDWAAGASYFCL